MLYGVHNAIMFYDTYFANIFVDLSSIQFLLKIYNVQQVLTLHGSKEAVMIVYEIVGSRL